MKKKLLLMVGVMALSGCANTMQGALQDASNNIYQASQYANENRDKINAAAEQTGAVLKRGGQLIGKGMKATGEYLQEITQ